MVLGREAQGAALLDGQRPNTDFWEKRAPLFARFSADLPADDPLLLRLRRELHGTDTVLDVGAGAGRYAAPLARFVRRVVAVEPSVGMRNQLQARIEADQLTNIDIVAADWEQAAVAPAEVVVCLHVHYAIADILPFLRKLNAHARRTVVMVSRVGQFRGPAELWQELHGQPRISEPSFIDLYNCLYSLGIVAEIETIAFSARWAYADLEEAVVENRDRLPADDRLLTLLRERLERRADGRWHWPAPPARAAILSWTPTPQA
jgi:SAM-dependent methyltransferase